MKNHLANPLVNARYMNSEDLARVERRAVEFFCAGSFVNFDCMLLDCHRITISGEVQSAPGVHIYTAAHPMNVKLRRSGAEFALPVTMLDGVWFGGSAIVCPGVTIGENTVIGAGSVVVRDLPANVLAVANPCRVVRSLLDA